VPTEFRNNRCRSGGEREKYSGQPVTERKRVCETEIRPECDKLNTPLPTPFALHTPRQIRQLFLCRSLAKSARRSTLPLPWDAVHFSLPSFCPVLTWPAPHIPALIFLYSLGLLVIEPLAVCQLFQAASQASLNGFKRPPYCGVCVIQQVFDGPGTWLTRPR
jgi:hypothetical protein